MSAILNLNFWIFVGLFAGIYTIFALGLQLQFGFTGLLNFGHVAFMAIAAYTMAIGIVNLGLPTAVAAVAGVIVSVAAGLLLGLPTLRLRADYLAIATIAFSEIVRNLATNLQGLTGGPQGTINLLGPGRSASFNSGWTSLETNVAGWLEPVLGRYATNDVAFLLVVWIVAISILLGLQMLVRSPWGRVLKAIREDEDAASALGKNVFWYKLQSLGIGAGIGGIAGLFWGFQLSFFSPKDFEPLTTFFAWIIVILGGTARNWGVPLGAVIFAVLFAAPRFFGNVLPFSAFSDAEQAFLRLILIGLGLIALMAFRPEGILGDREEMVLE